VTRIGGTLDEQLPRDDLHVVLPRRRRDDGGDLDITPMIDIVFLLLIFFLVASIPQMNAQATLPPARHGVGVNPKQSIIITVAEDAEAGVRVYLADGKNGGPLPLDPAARLQAVEQAARGEAGYLLPPDKTRQAQLIRQAIEAGAGKFGKKHVLLKADRGVLHREVARVAKAIGSAGAEGLTLNIAVLESQ
jgi:biopolymer transport protein ExbD